MYYTNSFNIMENIVNILVNRIKQDKSVNVPNKCIQDFYNACINNGIKPNGGALVLRGNMAIGQVFYL